jgi:hypothetical protein
MNIREACRPAATLAAFCVTLLGMAHHAHAAVRTVSDNLETHPTDWSLWYDPSTPGSSLAYHYGNNAALARSGKGVTLLQSGAYDASMWKSYDMPGSASSTISSCSISVYLRKVFSPTQWVRLSMLSRPSWALVQRYVAVTSTSYTLFSLSSDYGYVCDDNIEVWVEALGDGPLAGVVADDVTVKWTVP